MNHYAALAGRVRQSVTELARVVDRAEELMRKAQHSGDDGYLDGVALNLHGFYAKGLLTNAHQIWHRRLARRH